MKTSLVPLLAGVGIGLATALSGAEFQFPTQTLTVPDGFEIELVANAPLVNRPIEADFDETGRLYITDSSGSNDKPDKQLIEKPHRVVCLTDTDGDGRYDKQTVFADKMMFPEGAMWHDGSLYVSAPPSIWKLTDTDGDGVADKREEWFQGKTLTGCANDLHGPYFGPDGWIYWCKGAFAQQTYDRPGKSPLVTRAAHVLRARPDGSGIEPVMTGGMDNPVGLTFTASGERFFTCTFIHHPEAGKRDGVVHAIYGGVYGKVNDVVEGHKRTGDLMPVTLQFGAAAPCGITRYSSAGFGGEFRDNLFVCQFNMRKVSRHVLKPDGATFHTEDSDFVTSSGPDFHPTDVLEDADGSLIVVDTGGWYKLCCPTSQLAKPDVLGGIYRVRRKGMPASNSRDWRGNKVAWDKLKPADLARYLYDDRPALRQRAIEQLAKKTKGSVPALARVLRSKAVPASVFNRMAGGSGVERGAGAPTAADARRDAVWALTRLPEPAARKAVLKALQDTDDSVRLAAIHSASIWRDPAALEPLEAMVQSGSPAIRRGAAEALGRLGDKRAVPALLAASAGYVDRILEHSVTFALIEINDPESVRKGVQTTDSHTRRNALIALDQMDAGGLTADLVTPLLVTTDPVLKETAGWIVGRHPEWGGALAGFFRDQINKPGLSPADTANLTGQLRQLAGNGAIQEMLAAIVIDGGSTSATLSALNVMAGAGLRELPAVWEKALAKAVLASDAGVVGRAVAAARSLPMPKQGAPVIEAALRQAANGNGTQDQVRLDALVALAGRVGELGPVLFDFLRDNLAGSKPVMTRTAAATVLSKARLTPEQLDALTSSIKTCGPLEVPRLLSAYEHCSDEPLGLKLVGALGESKGLSGLRADNLKPRLTNFPEIVQAKAEELLARLNTDATKQKAHLDELFGQLKSGDVRRGQAVFNSSKAACATCHSIGYNGGHVGPDLTSIGQVRTERDLLEAIVYPSASFVRSYEPMFITTKSGGEYNGVVKRDGQDELLLATGPDTEVHIRRDDIDEMRPGSVSVMPQGLDEQLSRQELSDLLAFLKNTRWGAQ